LNPKSGIGFDVTFQSLPAAELLLHPVSGFPCGCSLTAVTFLVNVVGNALSSSSFPARNGKTWHQELQIDRYAITAFEKSHFQATPLTSGGKVVT